MTPEGQAATFPLRPGKWHIEGLKNSFVDTKDTQAMVEHNPGSAALNLWVFAAEIPPTHTLGILVGLNASSAFGVGF